MVVKFLEAIEPLGITSKIKILSSLSGFGYAMGLK